MDCKPVWINSAPDEWPPAAKTMFSLLAIAARRRLEQEALNKAADVRVQPKQTKDPIPDSLVDP